MSTDSKTALEFLENLKEIARLRQEQESSYLKKSKVDLKQLEEMCDAVKILLESIHKTVIHDQALRVKFSDECDFASVYLGEDKIIQFYKGAFHDEFGDESLLGIQVWAEVKQSVSIIAQRTGVFFDFPSIQEEIAQVLYSWK
jgi:hypothetical protein